MKKFLFIGLLLGGLLLSITVQAAEQCTVVVASTYSASQSAVLADGIVVTKGTSGFTLSYTNYRNNVTWIDTNQYRIQMFSISDTGLVTHIQSVNNTNHTVRGDIQSNVTGDVDYYLESYNSSDLECPITCPEGEIWNETTEQCEPDGTCPEGEIWNETTEQCEPEPGPCPEENQGPYYATFWGDASTMNGSTSCVPSIEPDCYIQIEDATVMSPVVPAGSTTGTPLPYSSIKYYVTPLECAENDPEGPDVNPNLPPDPGIDPDDPPDTPTLPGDPSDPNRPDDPVGNDPTPDPDPSDPTLPGAEMLGGYLRSIKGDTGKLLQNSNDSLELQSYQTKLQEADARIQQDQLGQLQGINRGLNDVEGAIEGGVNDIEASIDGMAGRLEGAIDGLGNELGGKIDGLGTSIDGIGDKLDGMATSETMPTVPEFDSSLPTDNTYTEFDDAGALATTQADKDKAYYGLLMQEAEPDTILGQLAAINPAACLNGAIMNTNVSICFDRPWMLTGYAVMKTVLIGIAYVQSMLLLMKAFQT